MNDTVALLVSVVVVYLVYRWVLNGPTTAAGNNGSGNSSQSGNDPLAGNIPGDRRLPRFTVRPHMVQSVLQMFPQLPEEAVRYDLARTGSVEITSDNILRNDGTLPMPPPDPAVVAANEILAAQRQGGNGSTQTQSDSNAASVSPSGSGTGRAMDKSLPSRFNVKERTPESPLPEAQPNVWEREGVKRQTVLEKKKEFLLLQARQRFLEKKKKQHEQPEQQEQPEQPEQKPESTVSEVETAVATAAASNDTE